MKNILTIIVAATAFCSTTYAQTEFSMNMMEHVFQSTYVNPTAKPDHKVSIGLPGLSSIYLSAASTPARFSEIYTRVGNENRYDLMKIAGLLNKESLLHFGTSVDLFHIRVKCRNTFLSFNIRTVAENYVGLPSSMGDILTLSNVSKIDADKYKTKTWDLNGLDANSTAYNEYAFGLSTFQKKFVYSIRLKYLQGLANVSLETENSTVAFNDDLELEAKGKITMTTSSPAADTSLKVPGDYKAENAIFNFRNMGFGADLGISYLYNSKLTFSFAANNLGFINWRTNPISFESTASTSFKGFDVVNPLINGEKVNTDLDNQFKLKKSTKDSYTSYLVPTFYFTTKYNFTPRFSVSGTVQAQKFNVVRIGLSAGAQLKLSRVFSLTGNVIYQYAALNFGAGFVFKPGPVQLYIAIDHLPSRIIDLQKNGSNNGYVPDIKQFNLRWGINLVFGREQVPQAQPLNY